MTDQETAGHTFNRWLTSEIKPFLGARGWRKRGATFELRAAPNTPLIALRRSKWSDAMKYEFFVEAGVFSPRLADDDATFAGLQPPTRPTLDLGAEGARLSSLMGEQRDVFWTIRAPALSIELDALTGSVLGKIEQFVLPFIEQNLTDEAIRDGLLSRLDDLGTTSLRRLRRLLLDLGPRARLPELNAHAARAEATTARLRASLGDLFAADEADVAAADAAMRRLPGAGSERDRQ